MREFIINEKLGQICIVGDTFSIRDVLKQMGARWVPLKRYWVLPLTPQGMSKLVDMGFRPQTLEEDVALSSELDEHNTKNFSFSVSDYLQAIDRVISREFNQSQWIVAEILSVRFSGIHCFLELCDLNDQVMSASSPRVARTQKKLVQGKLASLSSVIWGDRLQQMQQLNDLPLMEGAAVRVRGAVSLKQDGARLLFVIEEVDCAFSEGQQALLRKKIRIELKKRGIFELNKSKLLPQLPLKIALVTAQGSRAMGDFLHEISLKRLGFEIYLVDVRMQGAHTSLEVASAIKVLGQEAKDREWHLPPSWENFDCLVIARGGGSRSDLRWFDDIEIAKAICLCPIPVITAIGHSDDLSVSDEVAFMSLKTPTAAAQYLVEQVSRRLEGLYAVLDKTVTLIRARLLTFNERVATFEERIPLLILRKMRRESENVEQLSRLLDAHKNSYLKTFNRGFWLVKDIHGNLITEGGVMQLEQGDTLHLEGAPTREGAGFVTLECAVIRKNTLMNDVSL